MTDAEPVLDRVELATYLDLIEVVALLRRSIDRQLRDDGDLSYVQFQILAALGDDADGGGKRMSDIADGIVYSRSGLTYQVDLLERAGLVTRSPAEGDDRGVTVALTDAGRRLLTEVLPRHVAVTQELLLAPLTRGQVAALGDLLRPVRDHMRAVDPGVRARPRALAKTVTA